MTPAETSVLRHVADRQGYATAASFNLSVGLPRGHTRVYVPLDRLEAAGYIRVCSPETHYRRTYAVTRTGMQELNLVTLAGDPLGQIRLLHSNSGGDCRSCRVPWPCPTAVVAGA